ncbi:MAG TPA: TadG family pilus assembly protein, partial [Terriglobia bacterium]|nr:TadG family pilus assembly protein [Terriglobia bacterium]
NQNLVAGISPAIGDADVTFLSTSASNPRIQVIASRDTSHNNPMPTFFVKIFGVDSADVSAKAVAEAYNPGGGPLQTSNTCLKPWLMPNCDWGHLQSDVGGPVTPACKDPNPPYLQYAQFTYGTLADPSNTTIVDPTGIQGELLTIKSSDPSQASGPSQFYPVFLPPDNTIPNSCPDCALNPGGSGPSSGALYRSNISCCNERPIECGSQTIQPITGNMVGPTALGVDCLIHQKGATGQDTIVFNSSGTTPWTITAGSNNPYGATGTIGDSDSVVTIPLYDGTPLCPGNSCPSQVNTVITGYLRMFIKQESSGNVQAYVLEAIPCPGIGGGSTGSGGPGGVVAGGSSPIPYRLIHE